CGFAGMSGCYGMIGYCGFGGCFGGPICMGFMYGCFGSFPSLTQTYSKWTPSPSKAYYYRVLTVQTPAPNDLTFEFVLVHYPDRPKFLYYYDPVEKKYVGRYRPGARQEDCFHLVSPNYRKSNLADIPESSFRSIGGMPVLHQVIQTKPNVTDAPVVKTLKL